MADIIPIRDAAPLVLVCGECDNRSFCIYSESNEIECVGCGNRSLWDMQFVTVAAPQCPEKTDEGTKATEYHCFGRTLFIKRLADKAKNDTHETEILAVGVISRDGTISSWRADDIVQSEKGDDIQTWLKKRWMSLLQLVLAP